MKKKNEDRPNEKYKHWVERHWTSRGKSLEFNKHGYLKKIYEDQIGNGDGEIIYMKSSQVGLTERMITEALWIPDQLDYNVIYFFPTSSTIGDMVQERVDQPINNNEYLQMVAGRAKVTLGKQADKVGLKKMSKQFVYFRGSNALPAITSVAGDAIFIDELDRMTQENIPYFEKRLEHSNLRWQRWASTPTYPKFGIHKMYLNTDQTEYQVKCNHCSEWQCLDFNINVDKEKVLLICRKCKKVIVPYELEGEWVTKYKGKTRGYHISQLYSPMLNLKKFIQASEKIDESSIQQFYNQNLGIPYEPKGDKVTELDLIECKKDYVYPYYVKGGVFMGVDVGKKLHYVIRSRDDKILGAGSVLNFFGAVDSLESIIKQYGVVGTVVDALPETRKVAEFANTYKGRVKLCYYTGMAELKDSKKYWKIDGTKINTDRTISLDVMVAEYKKRIIQLPKNIDSEKEFMAHMQAPIRIVKEKANGDKKAEYIETSADHLFHACNYAKLASNVFNVATPEIFIV